MYDYLYLTSDFTSYLQSM